MCYILFTNCVEIYCHEEEFSFLLNNLESFQSHEPYEMIEFKGSLMSSTLIGYKSGAKPGIWRPGPNYH